MLDRWRYKPIESHQTFVSENRHDALSKTFLVLLFGFLPLSFILYRDQWIKAYSSGLEHDQANLGNLGPSWTGRSTGGPWIPDPVTAPFSGTEYP